MSVDFVAVVGKRKEPLFLSSFTPDVSSPAARERLQADKDRRNERGIDELICESDDIKYELMVYEALDRIDTALVGRSERGNGVTGREVGGGGGTGLPLFQGLLELSESHKVFGYCSNTDTIFIVVIRDRDEQVTSAKVNDLLEDLQSLYADALANPFHVVGTALTCPQFREKVGNLVRQTSREWLSSS